MKAAYSLLSAGSAAALGLALSTGARADNDRDGLSVQSAGTLALGNVVAATSGTTVFFIDETSGNVRVSSGAGVRTSSGSARALVTVACGSDSKCSYENVNVKVGALSLVSGRASALSNFDIQISSGALASGQTIPPVRGNPVSFTLQPIGRNGSASFYVGANFPIQGDDSGLSTGSAQAAYYVYVAYAGTTPTSGSTGGLATATVTRGLSLTSAGSLNFGTVILPTSGTGVVDVDADQGAYHNYNVVTTGNPLPSRVVFTAVGQPSTELSISIPATIPLVNSANKTLTVAVSSNAGSSGTLNSAGTYTFGVGGSINLATNTPTGVYRGTFTVSVCYN